MEGWRASTGGKWEETGSAVGDKGPLAPARNRSWERANAIQSVFRGLTSGLLRGACILLFETIIQLKVDCSGGTFLRFTKESGLRTIYLPEMHFKDPRLSLYR